MLDVVIRPASKNDCAVISKMIQELAEFEKMPDGPKLTVQDIIRDGFETNPPLFNALVADSNGDIVGYCLYFYFYSWYGKVLYIEDFFVSPDNRGKKIGSKLFQALAKVVQTSGSKLLHLSVLDWNPAKKFYEDRKGENVTLSKKYQTVSWEGKALAELAHAEVDEKESVSVRKADRVDCANILSMMKKLAREHKEPMELKLDALHRDGFDTQEPLFKCMIVEQNGFTVGYAMYCLRYSTWLGSTIYISEFFIMPPFRGNRIGSKLLRSLAELSCEEGYKRMNTIVVSTNERALKFYKDHGAVNITETEGWQIYSFNKEALDRVVAGPDGDVQK